MSTYRGKNSVLVSSLVFLLISTALCGVGRGGGDMTCEKSFFVLGFKSFRRGDPGGRGGDQKKFYWKVSRGGDCQNDLKKGVSKCCAVTKIRFKLNYPYMALCL
jgi:hypothetical protein